MDNKRRLWQERLGHRLGLTRGSTAVWYLIPRVVDVLLGGGSVPAFCMMGQVGRELGSLHILIRGVHICRVPGPGLLVPLAAFGERRLQHKGTRDSHP